MNLEKIAKLVKIAKTLEEDRRKARQRYRLGGQQLRRTRKLKQRKRRRQGGLALKTRVHIQNERLKYKPTRIRKEPLQKRVRDTA
jgi:hypothetical protein